MITLESLGQFALYCLQHGHFIAWLAVAMDKALRLADWKDLNLHRPYVEMTKSDLVSLGDQLDAPLHLTWSCYAGGEIHCGKCGTCVERKEAFELANIADPTKYEE